VERYRALVNDSLAVTGWRPRRDPPGHRLERVKVERGEVEDADMRLVARVVDRSSRLVYLDIAVVTGNRRLGFTRTRQRARAGPAEPQGRSDGDLRRARSDGKGPTLRKRKHEKTPLSRNSNHAARNSNTQKKRWRRGNCYNRATVTRQRRVGS